MLEGALIGIGALIEKIRHSMRSAYWMEGAIKVL